MGIDSVAMGTLPIERLPIKDVEKTDEFGKSLKDVVNRGTVPAETTMVANMNFVRNYSRDVNMGMAPMDSQSDQRQPMPSSQPTADAVHRFEAIMNDPMPEEVLPKSKGAPSVDPLFAPTIGGTVFLNANSNILPVSEPKEAWIEGERIIPVQTGTVPVEETRSIEEPRSIVAEVKVHAAVEPVPTEIKEVVEPVLTEVREAIGTVVSAEIMGTVPTEQLPVDDVEKAADETMSAHVLHGTANLETLDQSSQIPVDSINHKSQVSADIDGQLTPEAHEITAKTITDVSVGTIPVNVADVTDPKIVDVGTIPVEIKPIEQIGAGTVPVGMTIDTIGHKSQIPTNIDGQLKPDAHEITAKTIVDVNAGTVPVNVAEGTDPKIVDVGNVPVGVAVDTGSVPVDVARRIDPKIVDVKTVPVEIKPVEQNDAWTVPVGITIDTIGHKSQISTDSDGRLTLDTHEITAKTIVDVNAGPVPVNVAEGTTPKIVEGTDPKIVEGRDPKVVDAWTVPVGTVPVEIKPVEQKDVGTVPTKDYVKNEGIGPKETVTVHKEIKVAEEDVRPQVLPSTEPMVQVFDNQGVQKADIGATHLQSVQELIEVVKTVSEQIEVRPALVRGEEEVVIHLKPTMLDGSEIRMFAKDGVLTLEITPSTPTAEQLVARNVPQLERALAEHIPAFHGFTVAVKRGKNNESK
jgi:hypothetical protein